MSSGARLWLFGATALAGCGLTLTEEPPTYEELPSEQQSVVDRILANARAFHETMLDRGGPGIDEVLDVEAIQVHFQGLIVAANFGDGYLRVSVWESLTPAQQELIASWWSLDVATTRERYYKVFYDYMATHLAAIQWLYDVQGVDCVLEDRPRFNVERDAQRLVTAYYAERDTTPMLTLAPLCESLRRQNDATWSDEYEDPDAWEYFRENLLELADPEAPTGYFYFFCRWFDDGAARGKSLATEMDLAFVRGEVSCGE